MKRFGYKNCPSKSILFSTCTRLESFLKMCIHTWTCLHFGLQTILHNTVVFYPSHFSLPPPLPLSSRLCATIVSRAVGTRTAWWRCSLTNRTPSSCRNKKHSLKSCRLLSVPPLCKWLSILFAPSRTTGMLYNAIYKLYEQNFKKILNLSNCKIP